MFVTNNQISKLQRIKTRSSLISKTRPTYRHSKQTAHQINKNLYFLRSAKNKHSQIPNFILFFSPHNQIIVEIYARALQLTFSTENFQTLIIPELFLKIRKIPDVPEHSSQSDPSIPQNLLYFRKMRRTLVHFFIKTLLKNDYVSAVEKSPAASRPRRILK